MIDFDKTKIEEIKKLPNIKNKVIISVLKDEIKNALNSGFSVKDIYNSLKNNLPKWNGTYESFRRLIKNMQKDDKFNFVRNTDNNLNGIYFISYTVLYKNSLQVISSGYSFFIFNEDNMELNAEDRMDIFFATVLKRIKKTFLEDKKEFKNRDDYFIQIINISKLCHI
jgi:hypothetical protein